MNDLTPETIESIKKLAVAGVTADVRKFEVDGRTYVIAFLVI